jgi:hypothetical protein
VTCGSLPGQPLHLVQLNGSRLLHGLLRLLVSVPGLNVVAVEPNEAMIGGFKKVLPEVKILQGAAQQLPFDDSSVDAIFVGQVTMSRSNAHAGASINHMHEG